MICTYALEYRALVYKYVSFPVPGCSFGRPRARGCRGHVTGDG
jgi:hypothetical protein